MQRQLMTESKTESATTETSPEAAPRKRAPWFKLAAVACGLAAAEMALGAWRTARGAGAAGDPPEPWLGVLMLLSAVALASAAFLAAKQNRRAKLLVLAAYVIAAVGIYAATT